MNGNRYLLLIIFFVTLTLLSACVNGSGGISVADAWARPGLAEGNSAVFFVIENYEDTDDRLTIAHSDIAEAVELHKSSMVDEKMVMEMQDYVSIPGGGSVVFKPGDFHVMLIGLYEDLGVGDQFEVTLEFESAGEKVIDVLVREP